LGFADPRLNQFIHSIKKNGKAILIRTEITRFWRPVFYPIKLLPLILNILVGVVGFEPTHEIITLLPIPNRARYQTAPYPVVIYFKFWCLELELNQPHVGLQPTALPTELSKQMAQRERFELS
jgi:hypothetical protein